MALGLIKEYTRAMHLFIGIILHECIVAVALGLNSFRTQRSGDSVTKFALLFSSTVPIGIVIGVIVGYTPGAFGESIE
jgi:zinc transporter 1/2/3